MLSIFILTSSLKYFSINIYSQLLTQLLHQLHYQHHFLLHHKFHYQPYHKHLCQRFNLYCRQPLHRLCLWYIYFFIDPSTNFSTNTSINTSTYTVRNACIDLTFDILTYTGAIPGTKFTSKL